MKNIVLLSDGTGNSSAKLMKTNVWRLYEAIELATGDQVALYDNGVGTSSFKPLAILGGAVGWGLKRNVRNLYMFACRNYAPPRDGEPGDRIFAFGFSRGAFTIRVLIGLIQDQGLITGVKGRELERQAKWAYREYRRRFNPGTRLVRVLRTFRDWILRAWERRPPYTAANNARPRVAFVGLWDTVDAYGLPMDEMTRGWDQWVWPLSLCDHAHPAIVDRLCHAVALDDERHTFHPVLLDESGETMRARIADERLTQVWFAGVHSNIGGGYPDDSLAHVSLLWMAREADRTGLRLHPGAIAQWTARADPNGPASDSRRGLGSYYRYNPRSIQKLTDDRFADVRIPVPKIHESVFQRIKAGRDDYAPIVLPQGYAVVMDDGDILHGQANPYEHTTQSQSRCADQERVWNLVWWRRVAYFATVILTALLVLPPFFLDADGGGILTWRSRALAGVIELIGKALPAQLQPWTDYYRNYPFQLLIGGGLLAALLGFSTRMQQAIRDRMRELWDGIVKRPPAAVSPSSPPDDWVFRLRSSRWYRNTFEVITQRVFPFVFGFGTLAAVLLIIVGSANRATFAAASAVGSTCVDAPPRAWDGVPATVSLSSRELCQPTGLPLEAGRSYRVEIKLPPDWADTESLPVDTAAGFSSGRRPLLFVPFLPFRRVLTARWFVPMVRVGSHGAEYHTMEKGFVEFAPRRSGQLFLFVNDAIGIGPWLKTFYENNLGTATVTVRAVSARKPS
jgi:uncharacterized protein (DUF2235 family)